MNAEPVRPPGILATLDVPMAFTLTGVAFAFLCITFAAAGRLFEALLALSAAGLVDFYDGWLARAMQPGGERTVMSRRLDAIVDVCSFGMAPAMLAWSYGLRHPAALALLSLYVAAAALRLGYFSSQPPTVIDGRRYYVGMPVTYVALAVPWAFLGTFFWPRAAMGPVLAATYALLAGLMVSAWHFAKPTGWWYAVLTLIGLVPAGCYAWAAWAGVGP